ncbi:nucleotidyltransferase family protein [Marinomonas sp.]|nr:nucleotidyltransferase family protein [Marinomonas sp.]MDB4838182.1 nucleotidyltransferase family protein [Marinomonas sp.]
MAASLQLGDWCLAAGFVRNLIWDKLHDKQTNTSLNDIDLIYFNVGETDESQDLSHEAQLKQLSDLPWSVKNQARMHLRNGDPAYTSCSDAMSYWVELETAVGVTLTETGEVKIVAPFGLAANFHRTITLNPKRPKPQAFSERVSSKGWCELWPQLKTVS